MTLWLEITQDEYELPVAVADTIIELAKMRNIYPSTISKSMRYKRKSMFNKFIKVEIEENEE